MNASLEHTGFGGNGRMHRGDAMPHRRGSGPQTPIVELSDELLDLRGPYKP